MGLTRMFVLLESRKIVERQHMIQVVHLVEAATPEFDGGSDPARHVVRHPVLPRHAAAQGAMRLVIAATFTMSSAEAPRERSLQGRLRPWMIGPTARAPARRSTSL